MLQRFLRYETLLIASGPILGYLILESYYGQMEAKYNITLHAGSPNLMASISIGLIAAILIWASFALGSLIALTVPAEKSPWFWRIKRLVHMLFFLWFALYFGYATNRNYPLAEIYSTIATLSLPVIGALVIDELVWPLIKYRSIKSRTKRLKKAAKNEAYQTSTSYLRHLFRGGRIVLVLVPLILVLLIASNRGLDAADTSKPKTYMIIEQNSDRKNQQIILIDYGNSWLVAKYDDHYPDKPAYRKEYMLITQDKLSNYTIKSAYINYLYVYN